jgi:hypothetical protein
MLPYNITDSQGFLPMPSSNKKRKKNWENPTPRLLIKKKIKFSSYRGKFRVEQLQRHI